jgi:multiple RNA-binding domain-containing protein 1
LKEFLEVMQPASKAKTWSAQEPDISMEPPTKVQAIELPEAESDGEYEAVPKKSRKQSPPPPVVSKEVFPVPIPVVEEIQEQTASEPVAPNVTDDDWLRSRTNRLLDLMDPEDIPSAQGRPTITVQNAEDEVMVDNPEEPVAAAETEVKESAEVEDKPDPTIEAIRATGRLFVRNLPYTATEDDLRKHFAAHGALKEVCFQFFPSFFAPCFRDEYPDRDSLCYKHVM